jgi:hypothetical protein
MLELASVIREVVPRVYVIGAIRDMRGEWEIYTELVVIHVSIRMKDLEVWQNKSG